MYIDSSNLISIQICTYENLEKCQILSYKNQKYYGKCIYIEILSWDLL